ncbi:MAG TPA: PH domain-containing protein [Candidatus Dormibacteraeota bacterium]|jgi:uncharacterized membrane protein YdbT with pleckstrin-like domain|nr:PH domain-containing protein [Candidatus Dormibacteraeota bacterium]
MPDHILPGEQMLDVVHRHWIVLIRPLVLPVIGLFAVLVFDVWNPAKIGTDVLLILTLFVVAGAGVWLIVSWIGWASHNFTLTDQRVIMESGIISKTTRVIALDRVQNISTRQSLLGRILGYGKVEIDAAGQSGSEALDYIPDPSGFRDRVFQEAERMRRSPDSPAHSSSPAL